MSGETDLEKLLRDMRPEHNEGEYVFCKVDAFQQAAALNPICVFREREAATVILSKQQADEVALPYSVICSWITLTVHSSLEAVGLTAAVSKALTDANIVAMWWQRIITIISSSQCVLQNEPWTY